MRIVARLMIGTLVLAAIVVVSFTQSAAQTANVASDNEKRKADPKQFEVKVPNQISAETRSQPANPPTLPISTKTTVQVSFGDWLKNNALALIALVVAILGGLPGLLKILQFLRPISLKGSIKFYAPTSGDNPPRDGILIALTLVNQGSRNLIWRKMAAELEIGGKRISLDPVLITQAQAFNNIRPWENDLLKQQVIAYGVPINGYLHFLAPKGSIGSGFVSPSRLDLQFESESGRITHVNLHFVGNHPLGENESFPTHGVTF